MFGIRFVVIAWFVATSSIGVATGMAQDDQEATSTQEIMREKLDHAQQLLSAIVLRDVDTVEEKSLRLHYLSEFQSWYVLPTAEYARHSEEFRAAAQDVAAAGRGKDAEASSDAYSSMVKKCVQCHGDMQSETNR